MSRREFWGYPPSVPRTAKGGIKARSRRGSFGESWWAQRWQATLESFHIGARLERGRSYARRGQVLDVEIAKGAITASVQGSRARPYQVRIGLAPIPAAGWTKLVKALGQEARFAAQLLSGHLPEDIEQVFASVGLSLLPARLGDLTTSCSCPDWSNPCKHIAAVYLLLGEEFDRDPFLIFALRGMTRERLLARLLPAAEQTDAPAAGAASESVPLPSDPAAFWQARSLPADWLGEVRLPAVTAALLRRLGPFPLWRGETPLPQALEETYEQAARRGLEVLELGMRE